MRASESLIPRGAVCAKRLMLIPALANDDRACDDESSCEARDVYRFSECAACEVSGVMREHQLIRKASLTIFLKGC